MTPDKLDIESGNTDDVSMLRELLHTIRGLSPVSSTDFIFVPVDADAQSDVSYENNL